MIEELRSGNFQTMGKAVGEAIRMDKNSPLKEKMREGIRYYNYEHDIMKRRIFYMDETGNLREETNRSNVLIPHAFFTELVDQKVQYLLSNPVEFTSEDETLMQRLEEYIDEDFQLFLNELMEGSSKKAREYAFAYRNSEGRLTFQVADALKLIPIYDGNNEIAMYIRYYDSEVTKAGQPITVTRAEVWDEERVWYLVTDDNGDFVFDERPALNPRPHQVIRHPKTGELKGKGWGFLPFFELRNNNACKTDLEPVKALIDDYDIMACSLSNNLENFQEAIYVVRGYNGTDLDNLTKSIKSRVTIQTGQDGGVDVKEVNIPYEARKVKLELDKEAIYKFGMGFDSTALGDGNITNVVIKSRYSLLDLKANKAEIRLRKLLKDLLALILEDINSRHSSNYQLSDVEIHIVRSTVINENDETAKIFKEEETRKLLIGNILASAPRIGDDEALRLLCEAWDISLEEVQEALAGQDYSGFDMGALNA
ncbi:MAG: phage portal protein [Turicibacter sp.]|nr:phage portal protein [Turicibacter sp.]